MPEIVKAYDAHAGSGLVVVGVDLQENSDAVRSFASDFGMKFPIVTDRTGGVGDAWHIGGPIQGIPSSYFIDATGVVRAPLLRPDDRADHRDQPGKDHGMRDRSTSARLRAAHVRAAGSGRPRIV